MVEWRPLSVFWTNCPFPVRGVKFSFWYLMFQELKIHTFELSRLVSFFCFHALNSKHVYLFCHSLIRVSLLMNVGIISLNRFYVLKCLNAINLYLCEAISSLRFERLLPILVPPYSNLFNFRSNQCYVWMLRAAPHWRLCSWSSLEFHSGLPSGQTWGSLDYQLWIPQRTADRG